MKIFVYDQIDQATQLFVYDSDHIPKIDEILIKTNDDMTMKNYKVVNVANAIYKNKLNHIQLYVLPL